MLYIESIDFKDKADLKRQLEEFLAYSDEMAKKSILTALKTLETVSEEEIKNIKDSIR
ncbi:MAG: hypothetical protein IKA31_01215 [Clostridia bacterium]|nr:hypothetical protein [Clostridia bacterium]